MKKNLSLLYVFIFCLFGSCSNESSGKLEIRDYYAEGTADSNHLEKGVWKFYSLEKHKLCQEGGFFNGVRKGMWNYYFPFRDSIFWLPFFSKDSLIKTNIPSFLSVDVEEDSFIAFKDRNTSKLLLLKIGVASDTGFNSNTYNKVMLQEVINNSLKVKTHNYSEINTTCNRKYNFNKFSGIDKENRNYTLFTINSVLNNLLIEVTVRCNTEYLHIGEETFFSVISNLFIGRSRFFDENIDCEIIRNKIVSSKRTFSFGCNRQ